MEYDFDYHSSDVASLVKIRFFGNGRWIDGSLLDMVHHREQLMAAETSPTSPFGNDVLANAVYSRWLASGLGSSVAEIAESVGLTPSTVRRRLHLTNGVPTGCLALDQSHLVRAPRRYVPGMPALHAMLVALTRQPTAEN